METLGLSGPPARDESFFKRIFWPSADSADADVLGQQGFWVCLVLAVLELVLQLFSGHPLVGIFFASVYLLGGIGVREHDVLSAVGVTLIYFVDVLAATLVMRRSPGFFDLFVTILLLANIRGCWIASRWSKVSDPDLVPTRMNETWRDWLVDQMPAKVWPRAKWAFYTIAALTLLLTVWGVVTVMLHGAGADV